MIEFAENPWAARFDRLPTLEEIERRVCVPATPRLDLANHPPESAAIKLEECIKEIYLPTRRVCEILQQMLQVASAHAEVAYEDRKAFLRNIYCSDRQFDDRLNLVGDGPMPRCITGPSGVGKSQLLRAFREIMPSDAKVYVDESHPEFQLKSLWQISLKRESKGVVPALGALLSEQGIRLHGFNRADIIALCARRAYRDGICVVSVDEMQWITMSTSANALLTAALLDVKSLGIPAFYGANYSLCHRLLKRNSEDTNRLLMDPIILHADAADSEWIAYVKEIAKIDPAIFAFQNDADAEKFALVLHMYTTGVRRLAKRLISFAYRASRDAGRYTVTIADLKAAYESTAYDAMRLDVEVMGRQYVLGKKVKEDLWCPFTIPKSESARLSEQMLEHRQRRVAEQALADVMTASERRGYEVVKKVRSEEGDAQSASKSKLKRGAALTADDLVNAGLRFAEEEG